jgi:hypothetical protein
MSKFILDGGTDIAAMALFCLDAQLAEAYIDDWDKHEEYIAELERHNKILRISTGSDGSYLCHIHVDESIPESIYQYCVQDDAKFATISTSDGRIAFGGCESALSTYVPNANVRSDANILPGTYAVKAYRTEYPKDLISSTVSERIGKGTIWFLRIPHFILLLSIIAGTASWWYTGSTLPSVIYVGLALLTHIPFGMTKRWKTADALRRSIAKKYPSIVIQMTWTSA